MSTYSFHINTALQSSQAENIVTTGDLTFDNSTTSQLKVIRIRSRQPSPIIEIEVIH
ncbi:protein of unknown function [Candidatus Nitrotoga arctica]|uniref:Uncharacterized protein n=1 Tax=Candidatus Nitrotoga arctica TaxID=453162 RepID=A0ABN8AIT6_9PROT|nr:protein of unknown function [Candidatus Nitrotoga arctica]